jgi:hypothetical protein
MSACFINAAVFPGACKCRKFKKFGKEKNGYSGIAA